MLYLKYLSVSPDSVTIRFVGETVDIVIPVLNEEHTLPVCFEKLAAFVNADGSGYEYRIVIADNGSTDGTFLTAEFLLERATIEGSVFRLPERGRGRAIKLAWMESNADIRVFMDVDLSTDLSGLPPLLEAITEGAGVAIGSRLKRGAHTTRGLKREIVSRIYNTIIRAAFPMIHHVVDAQCGFKAVSRDVAERIVPLIKDNGWFLDTELLLIAQANRYKIAEIPVTWVDDPDSRVNIVKTSLEDLRGLARLRFGGIPRVHLE
jgi:glycosyltransferase involved in cell wall biosynthesis